MSQPTISLASIKTAYNTLRTKITALATAQTTVNNLGARPRYPTVVLADADYNNIATSIQTYDDAIAPANLALKVAQDEKNAAELAVIALLRTPGVWFKLVSSGGPTYTVWVRYLQNVPNELVVSTDDPAAS